jgi:hypothetical protein
MIEESTAMTTIWDKNGFIRIPVEQRHIDQSMERNSSHCMTGEAIRSAIPDATHISVDLQTIRWTRKGLRYCFLTPHICQDNIIAFDQGERDAIKPFELKMRPAFIAKAGKKRTHTPDDGELTETGLRTRFRPPIFGNLQLSKQLVLDRQSTLLGSARRYSYPSQNRRRVHPRICNLTTRSR